MTPNAEKDMERIKHTLGMSTQPITFYIKRHWTVPVPVMETKRGTPHLGIADEIVPKIDSATGEPVVEDEVWIEFQQERAGVMNSGEARVKDLLAVDTKLPADDFAGGIARARATRVIEYFQTKDQRNGSALPQGHVALEEWPAVTDGVRAILRHFHIFSVNMMAEATEAKIASLPGGLQPSRMREEAKAFLYAYQARALATSAETRDAEMTALKSEVGELKQIILRLTGQKLAEAGAKPEAPNATGASGAPAKSVNGSDRRAAA
jgi:hypothetical protein